MVSSVGYEYFIAPIDLCDDDYFVGSTGSLSVKVDESDILEKCGKSFKGTCYIFIRAYWMKEDGTIGGYTSPAEATFIYSPHKTLMYHNGKKYVECIPYVFYKNRWVECIPHYHDGHKWVKSSH